jgi:hypothetical protein
MSLGRLWTRLACVTTTVVLTGAAVAAAAASAGAETRLGSSSGPQAEISIEPAKSPLAVTFVAASVGFPSGVVSYKWRFGDGSSFAGASPTVVHTYKSASRFLVSVTEGDARGHSAAATGTLSLVKCPAGASCSAHLSNVASVQLLQVGGLTKPTGQATIDLFIGPYQIQSCEPQVAAAVAVTDVGFRAPLNVTLQYTTMHPAQTPTTCFASTVAFVDAAGKTVKSGPLRNCKAGINPPCVVKVVTGGSKVSKALVIPPGDPKVGAP